MSAAVDERAEMAVCGAVVSSGRRALDVAKSALGGDDEALVTISGRAVWIAVRTVEEEGREVNRFTVNSVLAPEHATWLTASIKAAEAEVKRPSDLRSACGSVRQAATVRRGIAAAEDLKAKLLSGDLGGDSLIGELATAGALLVQLSEHGRVSEMPRSAKDVLEEAREHRAREASGDVQVIETGNPELERYYQPRPGHLVIIGGRPKMGKTATAQQLALNAMFEPDPNGPLPYRLRENPTPVFYVCDEMTEVELMHRMLSNLSGLHFRNFARPNAEWLERNDARIVAAERLISASPMHIERQGKTKQPIHFMATAEVWRSKHKIVGRDKDGRPIREPAVIVADYLQQFDALLTTRRGADKREQVDDMLKFFKGSAKRLAVAMYVLSQLGRKVEARDWASGGRRPQSGDHKESSGVEQYADAIIDVYRDIRYDPKRDEYRDQAKRLRRRIDGYARDRGQDPADAHRALDRYLRSRDPDEQNALAALVPFGATELAEYAAAWHKLTDLELIINENRHGGTATVMATFEGAMYRVTA